MRNFYFIVENVILRTFLSVNCSDHHSSLIFQLAARGRTLPNVRKLAEAVFSTENEIVRLPTTFIPTISSSPNHEHVKQNHAQQVSEVKNYLAIGKFLENCINFSTFSRPVSVTR